MNLLSGTQPWIEVAFVNHQSLQLNHGIQMAKCSVMPAIPEKWCHVAKGLWNVPIADSEELTMWIDRCLVAVSGRPSYQLSGWIEGL